MYPWNSGLCVELTTRQSPECLFCSLNTGLLPYVPAGVNAHRWSS
jgi:hypothetical protein